ncbi:MAG: primosomal replication protein PriC [Symbiopectobacterium sp.]
MPLSSGVGTSTYPVGSAAAPLADRPLSYSRFDCQIFQSHGTRLRDYLNEVEQNESLNS